ncbi:MAG TPA: thioesterase family protein [Bacteroidales bacterium]|nr:thioesterase family protein [Bacteroidales bacterium]
MPHNLSTGIKGELTIHVTPENTAEACKSGIVAVFATPAMIGLMENTAHLSVQPYLEEGYITVGTEVNIKHIKATPVGMLVTAKSELFGVSDNKLQFNIEAFDETGRIGLGTHTRYIVHAATFLQKLQGK